jgi:fructose-1,6-bisphosphatase/inositol monophosphatase family enzyme
VDAEDMLELLRSTADAVTMAMHQHREWGLAGTRHGQYHHDLAADAAALEVLEPSGVAILSEESGMQPGLLGVTVVIDPIDGSTNASRGLPWWSTSLCAVDDDGPWVALVADQVTGEYWHAVRGGGAFHNDERIIRPATPALREAIIGLGGWPPFHFGWYQFRAFGAIALDLCAVADGRLDGYVHCVPDEVAEWDYLGGTLVCEEAGAEVIDVHERALAPLDHGLRRTPIAAGDRALLDELLIARRKFA